MDQSTPSETNAQDSQDTDKTTQDEKLKKLSEKNDLDDDHETKNENLAQMKKRKEYSKYDFIKVKVTLEEHFYVLSRFLVRRMLALCKIPQFDAITLSKDLKKFLVEGDKVELPQAEMNEILFQLMAIAFEFSNR